MKLIFISNNWADAHQQTRLNALLKLDIQILSIAIFRDYYDVESQFTPIIIGTVKHASYGKRIGVYLSLFHKLSKNVNHRDFLYVFGFDLMMICLIFRILYGKKIKIVYEVPDIREIFFSSHISGKLIRWTEKEAIPKIDLLIVTSPDFITNYFEGLRKLTVPDFLIIENKIHSGEIEKTLSNSIPESHDENKKIRIGYFGVLRCPASLNCLIKLSQNGSYEIILRGIFMPLTRHYEKAIIGKKHIYYLGPYQVPKDLNLIYATVDIVWAAYPFSNKTMGNHLFARTNRFYESLYFKKPFIVQKGTADAQTASLLGNIALEINLENEEETIEFLYSNLTPDHLAIFSKNSIKVPENHYKITNEYNDLETWLQQNR